MDNHRTLLSAAAALAFFTLAAGALQAQGPRFIRGDADSSAIVDISDPIHILSHLFLGSPPALDCSDAADVNDSGELDITDPIHLLSALFIGGMVVPPPYPACGFDPTPDDLPCSPMGPCNNSACGSPGFQQCGEGSICDPIPGSCGIADLPGDCVFLPENCPDLDQPVCGCDGKTYRNDCERLKAGVQKNQDGPCEFTQSCGGRGGPRCPIGFFCEFPDGTCGAADEPGHCTEIPLICTREFVPVCGCDLITYPNDCVRQASGISKLHDGPCEEGPR